MSQKSMTNFFSQSKRATRSSRLAKLNDVPAGNEVVPKKVEILKTDKHSAKVDEEANDIVDVKKDDIMKEKENKDEEMPVDEEKPSTKRNARGKKVEKSDVIKVLKEQNKPAKKSTRKKEVKKKPEDECPSPAKRNRLEGEDDKSSIEKTLEKAKKITAAEAKDKLKDANSMEKLKEKLKEFEKIKETAKVKKAKAEAAAKKVAEDKAKKEAKESYNKHPAFIRFHNLAVKPEPGSLPLPGSFKYLDDIFRCTEQIVAMLHNRQEIITFDKLKTAVQQMMRKSYNIGYLKQIKTVFPEAYKFAWENVVGRYGKKLAEFELNISVNIKYKEDIIKRLAEEDLEAPEEEKVSGAEKLLPQAMVERKSVFYNSLIEIVKVQHKTFCSQLNPPVVVDETKMSRFHKDFKIDECCIAEAELPPKPAVEVATTATQVLEKSRALFEVNKNLSETLEKAAEKLKEKEAAVTSSPAPVKAIRKDLQGLPQKLIEKILAKEAEQAAKDMLVNKDQEMVVKKLRRLPELTRILKGIFVTERKPALLLKIITSKALASYPGQISQDALLADIKQIVEISNKWISIVKIQGNEYLKINANLDVNLVVADIEKLIAQEEKKL